MNNKLLLEGFQELSADEVMSINGGGIFSNVFSVVNKSFDFVTKEVSGVFKSDIVKKTAETVGSLSAAILKIVGIAGGIV